MDLTLRQTEFFSMVAQELHFGRAAERLYVSQSVVSQEIRRLEKNLGVQLFDRSTRSVRLTPAGSQLVDAARTLNDAADNLAAVARRLSDQRMTRLRLVASPSAMDDCVPRVLREAETRFPSLQIEEIPVETGEVSEAIIAGTSDVGIGRFLDPAVGYRIETIGTEPLFAALSAAHPLAQDSSISLSRLADLPLLVWPRERNARYFDRLILACTRAGLDPLVLLSRPRIVGARSYLIAEGRAFGLIPASTARHPVPGIVTIPLASPEDVPLEVMWLQNDPRPEVQQFVELVRRIGVSRGPATP